MSKYACIIVSTPFQMISACAITEQFKEYSFDLYIIGNFGGYQELANKLKKINVFENIKTYELCAIRENCCCKNPVARTFNILRSYITFNKSIGDIVVPNKTYSAVFYAAGHSALEFLFYAQNNWKPDFFMFDDGVMSYRDVRHCLADNGKTGHIKRAFEWRIGKIEPTLLLYMPELFHKLNGDKYQVLKLNPVSEGKRADIQNIYGVSESDTISQKIIVIECKADDYLNESENEHLEQIYQLLIEKNQGDIIFKRHPRDKRKFYEGREYLAGSVPFEIVNSVQDMSDKVLIAWDSTGVITPKLFWGQEPRVVLLYKLVKGNLNNVEETDNFYKKFKECYEHRDRFIIPKSIEELKNMLGMV